MKSAVPLLATPSFPGFTEQNLSNAFLKPPNEGKIPVQQTEGLVLADINPSSSKRNHSVMP